MKNEKDEIVIQVTSSDKTLTFVFTGIIWVIPGLLMLLWPSNDWGLRIAGLGLIGIGEWGLRNFKQAAAEPIVTISEEGILLPGKIFIPWGEVDKIKPIRKRCAHGIVSEYVEVFLVYKGVYRENPKIDSSHSSYSYKYVAKIMNEFFKRYSSSTLKP